MAILTRDGRRLERFAPTRKGDPDNPLTDGDLADKCHELAGPVLGPARTADLLAGLQGLGGRRRVRDLMAGAALPRAAE